MESTEEALPGHPAESVPARRQRPRKSSRWVVGIVVAALSIAYYGRALLTGLLAFAIAMVLTIVSVLVPLPDA